MDRSLLAPSCLSRRVGAWDRGLILLDYDGTLVPIASHPSRVRPGADVIRVLSALVANTAFEVGIISGRSLADLRSHFPLDGLFLVGSHGAEMLTSTGEAMSVCGDTEKHAAVIRRTSRAARELDALPGIFLETKCAGLALHYRGASRTIRRFASSRFVDLCRPYLVTGQFSLLRGKCVVELRPAAVNKGAAVRVLLSQSGVPAAKTVYIGDDRTDEDAFRALSPDGLTVLVSPRPRASQARYRLSSPFQVVRMLERVSAHFQSSGRLPQNDEGSCGF